MNATVPPPIFTMFHTNGARIEGGHVVIDRKFLTGMHSMAANIQAAIKTVHPFLPVGSEVMDTVRVPVDSLPFDLNVVRTDSRWRPLPSDEARVRSMIAGSTLVYHEDFDVKSITRELKVPELLMIECDLRTQIQLVTADTPSTARRFVRAARCVLKYGHTAMAMRRAQRVHCNGYPAFDEVAHINPQRRMLYLDSRMTREDVISAQALSARLARHTPSSGEARPPLRLLYTGRFEAIKGALDAVRVARVAMQRGHAVEMHVYGQGSQVEAMRQLAAEVHGRIVVHDPVTYPELVTIAREFDVFVCCHVQSDPSCTYLESYGAGLPVIGYGNRMWRGLHAASGAGFVSPMHDVDAVVADLERYLADPALLTEHAQRARAFALEHDFASEFKKRTDDINAVLEQLAPGRSKATTANAAAQAAARVVADT